MTLVCQIRKQEVIKTPEEEVRQSLLKHMLSSGGYPQSLVAVEKSLASIPHLTSTQKLPTRRADIIVFGNNIHPEHTLYPLMLIECKAVPLTADVMRQVIGYNFYVKAYFLVIANADQIKTGLFKQEGWVFQDGLLTYNDAIKLLTNNYFNS